MNALQWLAGWSFLLLSLAFFVYWVFAWALTSGTAAFRSWGINFLLQLLQDILVVQVR